MSMDEDQTPEAVHVADNAYESLRAMANLTRATHPAPEVYRILREDELQRDSNGA